MVLKRRDAAFSTSFHFTITFKSTRFLSFGICNHWIRKNAHNSKNESFFKIKIDRPLFDFFRRYAYVLKILVFTKKRYSAENKQWVVNTGGVSSAYFRFFSGFQFERINFIRFVSGFSLENSHYVAKMTWKISVATKFICFAMVESFDRYQKLLEKLQKNACHAKKFVLG